MKSYKDLEIYKLSYDLAIKIHKMSLQLPKINRFIQYVEKEWKQNP